MEAVVGSEIPFAPTCEPMKILAGQLVLSIVFRQNVPKMYVLMDGVQIPVVAAATADWTGRIEGQRARTDECKVGCVFTPTILDKEGLPLRDPDSTTYVGAVETAEEFGYRINPKPGAEVGSGPPSGSPLPT